MSFLARSPDFLESIREAKKSGFYPYFRAVSKSFGPEVEVEGRRLVMLASNDYLGLSRDPRVMEAAWLAMQRWGTGPGGSRFLCGNTVLHEALEERLAAFLDKKCALVHTTGFGANLGGLSCLMSSGGYVLCDTENHASIFEGCRASNVRIIAFKHNSLESASKKLAALHRSNPDASGFLVTEGVFSMSGDQAILPELVKLKKKYPRLSLYVDDAHGLGVMHQKGRGSPAHFGVSAQTDFIMGTFSKALASVGGFVASDNEDAIESLRHQSRTLIFSAALPASNAAAAMKSLDILEQEPERLLLLHENASRARAGYRELGLQVPEGATPIVPIIIGSEIRAAFIAKALFENGIFAIPAIYPAVPKGKALIRTAFMATHEHRHIDFILETLYRVLKEFPNQAEEFQPMENLQSSTALSH